LFVCLANGDPFELFTCELPAMGIEVDVPPFDIRLDGPTLAGRHGWIVTVFVAVVVVKYSVHDYRKRTGVLAEFLQRRRERRVTLND
jgi:hypothetical protein